MTVLRTRTLASAGATLALAAAGVVAGPWAASAAPAIQVDASTKPIAGQSFKVQTSGVTSGSSYRMVLASGGVTDTRDAAEANSCSTASAATATTLTCQITEGTAGAYSLNLLDDKGAVVASTAVTVAPVVSNVTKPRLSDLPGANADTVTVYANPNVDSYTVQGDKVTFAANETQKDVTIKPTGGAQSTDVTVVATAKAGSYFADGTTTQTWTMRTTAGDPVPAALTVTEPTRVDAVGSDNDTITLRKDPNVTWTIGGKAVDFGSATQMTLPVTGSRDKDGVLKVEVVAKAADGFTFGDGQTSKTFSYEYTNARAEPTSTRIAGDTRFDTSVEVAKKYFPGQHDTVYVANGMNFPDALAAGPAAAQANAPLILTAKSSIQDNAMAEIGRMQPKSIRVVGGSDVVSDAVAEKLGKIAPVTRVQGDDRFETAAKVAQSFKSADTVYIASGLNFPDALAGGSGAARENAPMLLTNGTTLSDDTVVELRRLKPSKVVVVGGDKVVKSSVLRQVGDVVPSASLVRSAGKDRFETSALIIENVTGKSWDAKEEKVRPTTAFLATGLNYPDALAGIPAAFAAKAPLALTMPKCLPAPVKAELDKLPLTGTVRLGSSNVVGDFGVLGGACS
ncbi:cell wall-binding repeat-containing protein [Mobilicoccus pelagius]|uniref:Uncharacterized protein n=1 Tax=Mobilicoccus pelagius NBRC 104925 TaxID=1089455 RepID=H5UMZ4_9MICO|nr:cell wall-binding repeat-containing protein [Mobilicoccus pelagius]GAB47102.1 hypothetical protein MOPEL_003_01270 [Mobilicoccus pelagius NBRC 104925]